MKNNLNNKIIYIIIIIIFLIIIIYLYWLDIVTLVFSVTNILINNLEYLSNDLKDYLESNNISVTNVNDNLINETKTTIDNQTLETNSNNFTPSEETTSFYKSKPFWIITGMILVIGVIYIYKISSGDTVNIENNIQIQNNINNINNNNILNNLRDWIDFREIVDRGGELLEKHEDLLVKHAELNTNNDILIEDVLALVNRRDW